MADKSELELGLDEPERQRPRLVDWASFILECALRRRAVFVAVLIAGVSASALFYLKRAPVYRVETRILAQRPQALPAVLRGTAADDSPTRSASDLVRQRDNLVNIVRQAKLVDESPDEQVIRELDRALVVTTEQGAVTIGVFWSNAEEAYRIVQAAQQNFLEARHLQEVTAIDEGISILQARATALRENLQNMQQDRRRRLPKAVPATPALNAPESNDDAVRLRSMIAAKERAIQDVEEFRRRRLADLQAQLDQMRGLYSDSYPSVVALREDIAALSRESPQIAALREEEQKLRSEYDKVALPQRRSVSSPLQPVPVVSDIMTEEDVHVAQAREEYQAVAQRVNDALVELDAARAAFKYKYSVVRPAEVPTAPFSPNARKILGGGALGSIVLAFAAVTTLQVRSGEVLQRWQLERALDLPIIAQVKRD